MSNLEKSDNKIAKKGKPINKMNQEEMIDKLIDLKKRCVRNADDVDLEDFDLKDDKVINSIKFRDRCLYEAYQLEWQQRKHVDFEEAPLPLEGIFQHVLNPVCIHEMDLEPLNEMLTGCINGPCEFSSDFLMPEFEDVEMMLKKIRESGECPLYAMFVPKEGTEAFDTYVAKILEHVGMKIKLQRGKNFWQDFVKETEIVEEGEDKADIKSINREIHLMKCKGEFLKEEEPTEGVVDLETQLLDSQKGRGQQDLANTFSATPIQPTDALKIEENAQDVIELDSDSELEDGISDLDVGGTEEEEGEGRPIHHSNKIVKLDEMEVDEKKTGQEEKAVSTGILPNDEVTGHAKDILVRSAGELTVQGQKAGSISPMGSNSQQESDIIILDDE